jgi:hypothetical protein
MVAFLIPALLWLAFMGLVVALCQAADRGELSKAPVQPVAPAGPPARGRRPACPRTNAAREHTPGRLLARAASSHASGQSLRASAGGDARRGGAVTMPPTICPASASRWGHLATDRRRRSPIEAGHTVARASACGRKRGR